MGWVFDGTRASELAEELSRCYRNFDSFLPILLFLEKVKGIDIRIKGVQVANFVLTAFQKKTDTLSSKTGHAQRRSSTPVPIIGVVFRELDLSKDFPKTFSNQEKNKAKKDAEDELRKLASDCKLQFQKQIGTYVITLPPELQNGAKSRVFNQTQDIQFSTYIEAEDIVGLENKGLIDIPFAHIHVPSEDGRTSTEYIIRVPVFRTGLSVLEVICRILAKYRFEVHVCLDPIKNNLLPAKLNKALYEYIGRKRSSVSSTNESSSNSSSSPPRSFSIPPSRDTTGASVSPAGNDESEFQIFESTRVVDGRQISFIQFNPSNIIEIDDDDYAYYGDLNFLHFNVKSFSSVRRKVSEIYGLPEKNVTIYFYRRKPVLPTFSSELASKEETTASSSGAPGIPGAPQSSPASMPSASELAKSFAPHATVEEAKKNEAAFKNMLTALSQNRRAGGLQNTSIRPDRGQRTGRIPGTTSSSAASVKATQQSLQEQRTQHESGNVDTVFITNVELEKLSNWTWLKNVVERISPDSEIALSIAPRAVFKQSENDIDFCTRLCAERGVGLVTGIKSTRVDLIDYVSMVNKYEPITFILPKPGEPLFQPTIKRPVVGTGDYIDDIALPFSVDLFEEVVEQYERYLKDLDTGRPKLTKILLPVWNFQADIDLNAIGTGFVRTKETNQNLFYSKIFSLPPPQSFKNQSGVIEEVEQSFKEFMFKSNLSPEVQLLLQVFFRGMTSERIQEFAKKFPDVYEKIINNNFQLIQFKERDASLPPIEMNAIQWSVTFTTFGVPFFQPGGCYDLINFLPDFFYQNVSFSPEMSGKIFKWRWRCVEVTHNFGVPYTMNVKLSV